MKSRGKAKFFVSHFFDIVSLCMNENIAEKILSKDLENIVRKVAQGKPLSTTERARIEQEYSKNNNVPYATNYVELANILGVNRKTIKRWRDKPDAPSPLSNGKHDVSLWRQFVRNHNLKSDETEDMNDLKARKLFAEVRQAEIKTKVMEGKYVSIETVNSVWTQHISQVKQILETRLLNEMPPLFATLTAVQIRQNIQNVLDECYMAIRVASEEIVEPIDLNEKESGNSNDSNEQSETTE